MVGATLTSATSPTPATVTAERFPATLPALLADAAGRFGDRPLVLERGADGTRTPLSFRQFAARVTALATGLADLGVAPGDTVGLIADNRPEWLEADLAILSCGAADVPRGADMTAHELATILGHAEAVGAFVEDRKGLERLLAARAKLPRLRFAIVMDGDATRDGQFGLSIADVRTRGQSLVAGGDARVGHTTGRLRAEDLATIIYTSGTSGDPKGVRLRHANLLHNVRTVPPLLEVRPDDTYLSILPAWHAFERVIDYVVLAAGGAIAYSSPARQILVRDLAVVRPTLLAAVPRVWEALMEAARTAAEKQGRFAARLFSACTAAAVRQMRCDRRLAGCDPVPPPAGARPTWLAAWCGHAWNAPLAALARRRIFPVMHERLGGRARILISGGGALPTAVDEFFAAAGLPILEGYGLTETSPVLTLRRPHRHITRTVGWPVPETEIRVVDPQGQALPFGQVGRIHARGPQVMEGYHKRRDLTSAVLSQDLWFDTGDLGLCTPDGMVRIVGRAKDTIALRSGEKVEPDPIETRLRESPLISQVVVLGQDQPLLAALVVPKLDALAARLGGPAAAPAVIVCDPRAISLVEQEITRLLTSDAGFKRHERVGRIHLLAEEFAVGRELTPTLKVKRAVVAEQYKDAIAALFAGPGR